MHFVCTCGRLTHRDSGHWTCTMASLGLQCMAASFSVRGAIGAGIWRCTRRFLVRCRSLPAWEAKALGWQHKYHCSKLNSQGVCLSTSAHACSSPPHVCARVSLKQRSLPGGTFEASSLSLAPSGCTLCQGRLGCCIAILLEEGACKVTSV